MARNKVKEGATLQDVARPLSDVRLSYSSASTLSACEQKWQYYKVEGIDKDPDADESTEAFDTGTAFHYVNEKTLHQLPKSKAEFNTLLAFAQSENNLSDVEYLKVKAYLLCYWKQVSIPSGLKVVEGGVELEVSSPDYIGFIDAVMVDPNGMWWIVDLKTASSLNVGKMCHLHMDEQLNLYTYHAPQIAEKLKLSMKDFAGCRYRVTVKTRATFSERNDTDDKFVRRIMPLIKSYDFEVPKEKLQPTYFYAQFKEKLLRSKAIRQTKKAKRNYNACYDYYKPCEYWSRCHKGELFTEAKNRMGL